MLISGGLKMKNEFGEYEARVRLFLDHLRKKKKKKKEAQNEPKKEIKPIKKGKKVKL